VEGNVASHQAKVLTHYQIPTIAGGSTWLYPRIPIKGGATASSGTIFYQSTAVALVEGERGSTIRPDATPV
jgi:hypothetical protein